MPATVCCCFSHSRRSGKNIKRDVFTHSKNAFATVKTSLSKKEKPRSSVVSKFPFHFFFPFCF